MVVAEGTNGGWPSVMDGPDGGREESASAGSFER